MFEAKQLGVQQRAIDRIGSRSVQPVAQQRKARVRHVHAKLMRASGVRHERAERESVAHRKHRAFAQGGCAVASHFAFIGRAAFGSDRRVDKEMRPLRYAAENRRVSLLIASVRLLQLHARVDVPALCDRHETGRALVEATHRMRILVVGIDGAKRVLHGRLVRIARGMHGQVFRLVDHRQVRVRIDGRKRMGDRLQRIARAVGRVERDRIARVHALHNVDRRAV